MEKKIIIKRIAIVILVILNIIAITITAISVFSSVDKVIQNQKNEINSENDLMP